MVLDTFESLDVRYRHSTLRINKFIACALYGSTYQSLNPRKRHRFFKTKEKGVPSPSALFDRDPRVVLPLERLVLLTLLFPMPGQLLGEGHPAMSDVPDRQNDKAQKS